MATAFAAVVATVVTVWLARWPIRLIVLAAAGLTGATALAAVLVAPDTALATVFPVPATAWETGPVTAEGPLPGRAGRQPEPAHGVETTPWTPAAPVGFDAGWSPAEPVPPEFLAPAAELLGASPPELLGDSVARMRLAGELGAIATRGAATLVIGLWPPIWGQP